MNQDFLDLLRAFIERARCVLRADRFDMRSSGDRDVLRRVVDSRNVAPSWNKREDDVRN